MRSELAGDTLSWCLFATFDAPMEPGIGEIPCIFPASGEFGLRDGFARECPLPRGESLSPMPSIAEGAKAGFHALADRSLKPESECTM